VNTLVQTRTKRQREVLDYITRFIDRNGYGPSYQLIARHLGVSSKAGVQRHIEALETMGLVSRKRENGSFSIELPMRHVAAESVCVVEHFEISDNSGTTFRHTVLSLPKVMVGSLSPEDVMTLKVPDDSLEEKGLSEGDILLLEKRSYGRRGDIGAFMLNGLEIVVGQYYPQGPETEIRRFGERETLLLPADEVAIMGIMRGFLRPIPSLDE